MTLRETTMGGFLAWTRDRGDRLNGHAQAGAETFTATATVKTAGGASGELTGDDYRRPKDVPG